MGEVKSKPNPKQVFDACVGGILEGLTQKQIIKTLDISKDTLKKKLAKKNTSWKELTGQKKVDNKVMVTSKVDLQKKVKTPHLSTSDDARQGDKPGTPLKLTEEVLEDALVRVLQSDPTKALGPALTFLDKKKSLSVNDDETEQTEDQKKYYNEVLNNIYR